MKKYNSVMLGRGGKYAKTCRENGSVHEDWLLIVE